ncbi:hypothetical protein HLV37_03785 [Eggerthellaceae bacterium zg-1084]|uniref:hypothetical protein n=1 Tax=Berryella wangjianweii TaxID=2734634 RepID=UPI0015572D38|nr:hypothetical protein [Berryella wangjianweii]NPD30989.1 hypothetical protein [Berryella wangjianweii]
MAEKKLHDLIDEQTAAEVKETVRRPPFRFSEVGIPFGNVVRFVEDDRHIRCNSEVTSLSRLPQDLKGFDHPVQGTLWFAYEGKILNDIRNEREAGR